MATKLELQKLMTLSAVRERIGQGIVPGYAYELARDALAPSKDLTEAWCTIEGWIPEDAERAAVYAEIQGVITDVQYLWLQ